MLQATADQRGPVAFVVLLLCALIGAPASAGTGGVPVVRDGKNAYPYIMPILGSKAAAKGAKLPLPWGISLNYTYVNQVVLIDNMQLGFNDGELLDVDFIQFGENRSKVQIANIRMDMWLFPFLNLYVMGNFGHTNIDIKLVEPVALDAGKADPAYGGGFGVSTALGYKGAFLSVDTNLSWNMTPALDKPASAWILGFRAGYGFALPAKDMRLAMWAGTMRTQLGSDTEGQVRLGDVVPDLEDGIQIPQDKIDQMTGPQQVVANKINDALAQRNPADHTIQYAMDKRLQSLWELLFGVQWTINKHWEMRVEIGTVTKFRVLAGFGYRFGLKTKRGKHKMDRALEKHPLPETPETPETPEPAAPEG